MDKKKVLYISLLFIITVIVSITYFSYAFFTSKEEYHGKINVVAGTLDYKIESNDLTNNLITLNSKETKKIEVEITSLNDIASKYELYYQTNNNEIEVGYASDTIDSPSGEIGIKSSKKVTVVIKNKTDNSATISFGVQGGLVHNQIALETGKNSIDTELSIYDCNSGDVFVDEGSTGNIESLTAVCEGTYKIEAWGASGGGAQYGYGGYSTGNIILNKDDTIYYAVGGQGGLPTAGYNGGGLGSTICGGGGGATHVALDSGLLSELSAHKDDGRILIVAAGGGGSWNYSGRVAGSGGGYVGVAGTGDSAGAAASQSAGGRYGGTFGQGGNNTLANFHVSGGGGGYYGGGAGYVSGSSQSGAGGGGSSYIASTNLTNKSMYCYKCTEDLTNTSTFTVNTKGTSTAGASYRDTVNCSTGYSSNPISKCAKDGDGYIKITYLGTRTVTFNTNGGTVSEIERIVNYGNSIGELPIPTRGTDYFEGWYLEDTFTTKVDSNYIPTENITLYARYGTEVNMNLAGRTGGYPSNTNSDLNTKRSYTMNTYIVGLAYNNYYSPSNIANYSLGANSYYVKQSAGYGIGLPMQLVNGNYIVTGNVTSNATNVIISIVKYTSDGTPSYNSDYAIGSSAEFRFTIGSNDAYEALVITGGGSQTEITVSNIHLYKLD